MTTFSLCKRSDHVTMGDVADVITWKVMLVCAPFSVPLPNLKVSGFGFQVLGKTNTKAKTSILNSDSGLLTSYLYPPDLLLLNSKFAIRNSQSEIYNRKVPSA